MNKGHPLQASDMLPKGWTVDDVLVLAIALGIFLVIWSGGQLWFARVRYRQRLKSIEARRAELRGTITAARRRKKARPTTRIDFMRQVVQQLKLLQQHQVDVLQQKLTQAGYRSKDATMVYAFAKLVMPFVGLAAGLLIANIDWSHPFSMHEAMSWFMFIGCGYFGARMPDIIVANRTTKRYHAMRKALPDALDLLMICAESGLSLTAALDRVARETQRMSPELADELSLTSVELGFLPDRATALKHLNDRVNIREVRGLVNVIAQTEKYGTPIAQALRVLSKEYRTERMLRAEQKAARLPAMMTVPMIVFILPTLFVIVMAPAIIGLFNTM